MQVAQDHWLEILSSAQMFRKEQQPEPPRMTKKKKKCHGNRKLPHFKRKCRARGLTHESRKQNRDDQSTQKSLHSSTESMSQLSISQEAIPKKNEMFYSRKKCPRTLTLVVK